jgi:cobalt-zinc-cadmium efflux system outer membrane protein
MRRLHLSTRLPTLFTVAVFLGSGLQIASAQIGSSLPGAPVPSAEATSAARQTANRTASLPGSSEPQTPSSANATSPSGYAASATSAADPRRRPTSRPGALTLQQVVQVARDKNPTLQAAAETLRSVRAQEIQAGVRANPNLGLNGSNVSLPAQGAANPYAYAVQVSRLFERGNKRQYRLQDARATTAQTAAQLEDTTRQTTLLVKQAFTQMLITKAALELSNANLKDYRHEVDIANDRYKAGDLGKLDFERIDLQLGSFEADHANAEINLIQASDQLQTFMGVDLPSKDFDIIGDIVPPVLRAAESDLVRTALLGRPDYLAARSGVTVAEAASRLAIANGTADPTLEGEYDRSGTYNSAGFNISVPIRLFDRNQGNKETARLQANAARLTELATRNQVVSDIDQAWVGYTRARALSDRFGEHYLDESSDVLTIARFAFDHGGLALIDYLDALRDSRASTADALNAYSQTWLAIHQLSAASASELTP